MDNTELYKEIDLLGQQVVQTLKQELQNDNKDVTSKLINSIQYRVNQTADGFELDILSENYLKYVDKGRAPGKMPPSQALIPWVEAKGIRIQTKSGYSKPEAAAFVVARSIGKKGIKPTNVIDRVKQDILNQKKQDIEASAIKDMNNYINNLFAELKK